jgi:hypothetical protein
MKETPASNTREYQSLGPNEVMGTVVGLTRYFEKVLAPTLENKEVGRIVLVDHSGSGASVDGFQRAFLDAAYMYDATKEIEAGNTEGAHGNATIFREYYENVPWYLLNVVDFDRRSDGPNPPTAPRWVEVLDVITAGNSGELNKLVGDTRSHPRVTPDYPPNKWEVPIKDCWGRGEEAMAKNMKDSIIRYNKNHGGLIGSPDPITKLPKKKNPSKKQLFFSGFPGFFRGG